MLPPQDLASLCRTPEIVVGVVLGVIGLVRIIFLGDTIAFIIEEINKKRLRDYVRKILGRKYSGSTFDEIADAIGLDHGAFGLRLKGTAIRTVLDSETISPTDPTAPNLVVLHETGKINLRIFCGFDPQPFWNTKRYKTLKKETVIAGGGGGEFDNPISEDELKDYLDSRGARGPKFTVIAMRDGVLDDKISVAEDKGRELGVMLDFDTSLDLVSKAGHIVHDGFDTMTFASSLVSFLEEIVGRKDKAADAAGATADLCHPVIVGVFQYTDGLRGLTSNLAASACGLSGEDASGLTFIDNIPDQIWKYVPIHELGHYFGLCHVDGLDRIMYSSKQNSWWSWWMLPTWLYLEGEPSFIFDEAKAAWDYIAANFSATCLGAKPGAPIG